MQVKSVADVIESNRMGELGVQQSDHLAPRAERPGLLLDSMFPGQLGDQVVWDEVAELPEDGEFGAGWLRRFSVFHPCRVAGESASANLLPLHPMGWL